MIFNVPGHIEMIRNGLRRHPTVCVPQWYVKTQTRRINRRIYQVGRDYAVQSKREVKAETDIRIVMDEIWDEKGGIYRKDALAEGGYQPAEFEEMFFEIYHGRGNGRWAFKFHVIEVQK